MWEHNNRFLWVSAIVSRQSLSIHTRIILSRICTVAQRRTLAVLRKKKMNRSLLGNVTKFPIESLRTVYATSSSANFRRN